VACPWFIPDHEVDFAARPRPARAPLGTVFTGTCSAVSEAFTPPDHLLYEPCNFGYGRGRCPLFPADTEADAIRFSGSTWILEKEWRPISHGSCAGPFPSPIVELQAKMFRKHER
jgi:hypothetical protein